MTEGLAEQLAVLESTDDPVARNAMALDLAQTQDPAVLPVLIRLIAKPRLANCRATLVRCLRFYEYADYLELLIELVVQGNWEVAHEAHSLLSEIEELSGSSVTKAFVLVNNAIGQKTQEEWRHDLLEDLLSMFE